MIAIAPIMYVGTNSFTLVVLMQLLLPEEAGSVRTAGNFIFVQCIAILHEYSQMLYMHILGMQQLVLQD